jgi:protein-disulfide isomerase
MTKGIWFSVACIVLACANAADVSSASSGLQSVTVAEVGGTKLTRADFEKKVAGKLFQAQNTYHESERRVLDELIDELLLEQQAAKEGLTVSALLDKHVNSKVAKDPSDDALRVYYEGLDTKESFEAVRDKILEHLRMRRANKIKAAYLESIRKQGQIRVLLAPPRANVSVGSLPVRGNVNAPVTIIEYADYECPFCQQIQPALDKLEANYADRLAFAYKDVPLPVHANAQKAAEAKHCAGAQGKYWEYHDALAKTKQFDAGSLKQHARTLQLDTQAFDQCLDSGQKASVIQAHVTEAQGLGLQGTPSFFINGRFFSGALTYEKLQEVVEEELANSSSKSTGQKTAAVCCSTKP